MFWKTIIKGKTLSMSQFPLGAPTLPNGTKYYFSDDCKWSAEPQTVFEGHMKKTIKEALEKKVVWPWVTKEDSEAAAAQKKKLLKSKGFKEWKNAKAKGRETNWTMRYAVDVKTGKLEMTLGKNIFINIFRHFRTIWQRLRGNIIHHRQGR